MAPPTDSRLWPFVPWCCNEKTSNALKCQKLKKVPENLVYAVQGTKPILFGPENKKTIRNVVWHFGRKQKYIVFHTRNPILCQYLWQDQTTAYLFSEKYCTFSWISIISWNQWIQMSIMFEGSVTLGNYFLLSWLIFMI